LADKSEIQIGTETLFYIESIITWIRANWLWLTVLSLVIIIITVAASIGLGLAIILSLPPDYFTRKKHISRIRNPVLRFCVQVIKNLLGVLALVAGFIMLFTPGQGILTIFVGIILCDFPGKRKLERRIIAYPVVLDFVNKIRLRYKRAPIVLEHDV
jgi:hypothetical protein